MSKKHREIVLAGVYLLVFGLGADNAYYVSHGSEPLVSFTRAADKSVYTGVEPDALGLMAAHRAVLLEPAAAAVYALNQLGAGDADFNATDIFGNAPLHLAVLTASPTVIRALLENGAAIDQLGADGCSPLLLAVEAVRPQVVAELLKAGADPMIKDKAGRSAHALARVSADARIRAAFSEHAIGSKGLAAEDLAASLMAGEGQGAVGYNAALVQLRKLGSKALPPFIAILSDASHPRANRLRAARILGDLHDKAAVPALMKTLREGDVRLARQAAASLKKLTPRDQAMDLCKYLAEVDPGDNQLRASVYEAIGTAGNPEALPFLMYAQANEIHPDCRTFAGAAVDAIIGQKIKGDGRAQKKWIKKNHPEWMRFFKEQTQTDPGFMGIAWFFVLGVVLAAAGCWYMCRQII